MKSTTNGAHSPRPSAHSGKPVEKHSGVLLALVIAICLPTLITWIYFELLAERPAWCQQWAYGIGKTIQFLFPILFASWMTGKRFPWCRLYELNAITGPRLHLRTSLLLGGIFGSLVVILMIAVYASRLLPVEQLASQIAERTESLALDTPWKFGGITLFYALIHSALEEYYFRWFIFGLLRTRTSFLPAAVLSSLSFMSHHVLVLSRYFDGLSFATLLLSMAVAVGGFVWCWHYERSESLTGPWLSHLLVDAGIFGLGYFLLFS